MSNYKEEVDRTERLKTTLGNKVESIGNIINTKIKEKPTTLTQAEDSLRRKMLGIGDIVTDLQIEEIGYPTDGNGVFKGHTNYVKVLAVDNEYIYSGGSDKTVRKIRKSDMVEVGKFTGHTSSVDALTVDNEYIYSGSGDKTVRKIRKSDMVEVYKFTGHTSSVYALTTDSEFIYSGSYEDKTVRKIRKSDMVEVDKFTGHTGSVYALTLDSEYLYSGSTDNTVRKLAKSKQYKIISI